MASGNQLCANCRMAQAEQFCPCTDPETLLCAECVRKHRNAHPDRDHPFRPVDLLPFYKIPGYFERLKVRFNAFPQVRQRTLDSIEDVDRAIQTYTNEVEKIIRSLSSRASEVIRELEALKEKYRRDMESTLEEVERTMKEDTPTLTSPYGALIRGMAQQTRTGEFFSYSVDSCSAPQDLVVLRYQFPRKSPQFAGVFTNTAFLYDVDTEQLTKHALSVDFGVGGSYVELDNQRLLCIGARPPSSAVYELDVTSFELSLWPALSVLRKGPGVAKVGARVYVLGGYDGKGVLRSCEKLAVAENAWRAVGDMHYARLYFTPCPFRELLYLVCSKIKDVRAVETFSAETEVFAVLQISLPPQLTLGGGSVAFVAQGELCLLTEKKQMCRWKVDTESEFRLSETDVAIWSTQQPFIVGSMLLISYEGGVLQFSLETYSRIKYVK